MALTDAATLAEVLEAMKQGICPNFDGTPCEYPDDDCIDCDPVAVASVWTNPAKSPRQEWEHGAGPRMGNRCEHWLKVVLREVEGM